jgi:hypothetical protein
MSVEGSDWRYRPIVTFVQLRTFRLEGAAGIS